MNVAFLFPGQGSQIVGMGKDFYDHYSIARETFQIIDDTLKRKLSHIIFNGPHEDLTLTINAQPALMAVSMAILSIIKDQTKKDISKFCSYVAGHSLGEYSALCATESMSLSVTAKLLQTRSHAMQEACPSGTGIMAACIGITLNELEKIINNVSDLGICQIANDNIVGQIVISGHALVVERVISIVKNLGFQAIKLKVSAPFHCSLMKCAEEKMTIALNNVIINRAIVPVIQNITAKPTVDPIEIKQNLILQICGRVRWRESLDELQKRQVEEIVEIGSGTILTNMLKKADYQFKCINISNIVELETFLTAH